MEIVGGIGVRAESVIPGACEDLLAEIGIGIRIEIVIEIRGGSRGAILMRIGGKGGRGEGAGVYRRVEGEERRRRRRRLITVK